jgi:ClpP class serine protease
MNKPELISFSEFLMIAPYFDQRQFFAPEIQYLKGGIDALLQSGLIQEEQSQLIEYRDNVAILKIEGPLRPGRDWYYATGYGDIQDAIDELMEKKTKAVIQLIDSPGGTVKQAFETEEKFRELAKVTNLISLVTGSATSAASLMTFPAKKRYIASKTAQTGSIGVVAEHVDNRVWYREFLGEIRTSVAKGDLKDAGTDTRGFDAKAKKVFEQQVAKLYDIFAESASKGLKIPRKTIDEMQSGVFIGQEGIDKGFADGFATLNDLVDKYNKAEIFTTPVRPAFSNVHTEKKLMDRTQYKAEHPDEYKAIVKTAGDEREAAVKQTYIDQGEKSGKAAGILAERARISDIQAYKLPKDFTEKAISEGWPATEAADKYLKADAENRKDISKKMEDGLKDGVSTDAPDPPSKPEDEASDPVKQFNAEVAKTMAETGKREGEAMKIVKTAKPELHAAWVEAINKGGKQ